MQATLEAVDRNRLRRFFVKVVPLGNCSGVKSISVAYAVVDAKMHLNLYWWLHLVHESTDIRHVVRTATRP